MTVATPFQPTGNPNFWTNPSPVSPRLDGLDLSPIDWQPTAPVGERRIDSLPVVPCTVSFSYGFNNDGYHANLALSGAQAEAVESLPWLTDPYGTGQAKSLHEYQGETYFSIGWVHQDDAPKVYLILQAIFGDECVMVDDRSDAATQDEVQYAQ